MTSIKDHVIDERGYVLMGDSRGILVDWNFRHDVYDWADKNNISIEYQGSMSGKDLWYVKNDNDRTWFVLRWNQ